VIGTPFQREHEAVVEVPERRGALQVDEVVEAGQRRGRRGDPVQRRSAVDCIGRSTVPRTTRISKTS